MKTIAHIDMDAFFASVEQRDDPRLRSKPVIVGADPKKGKGRGVVSTCSYEARQYGIHSAMPISRAYRLCPQGIYVRGNMEKYKKASDEILTILYDFTPDIEPISIDEAFFDLTGCFHFHGTALKTCQKIKERIKQEIRLTASIGIAPNKMVAKIASDMNKPDGLLEVKPKDLFDFLWPLPIEKLWGVGPQTQKAMNRCGIQTVEDIALTPHDVLTEKFGKSGEHLYRLAQGIDDRDVTTDDEIKSVSHEHTFDKDTESLADIDGVLSSLSELLSRRLRRYGLKGKILTLKVRLSDFRTFNRSRSLPKRTCFFEDIYGNAKQLFDAFYQRRMKIRLIGVKISHFDDLYVQDSLFDQTGERKIEKIHTAVDVIKNRFGEKAIQRGRVPPQQ